MNKYIEKLISIAKKEVGYLEKKSNSNLDSKTANAGYNNYTKYWRDIADWGFGNYQGQYWCAAFIFYCFVKAFGIEKAKKLLLHAPYISCATAANLFNKAKQLYASPKVGDIVIFKKANNTFGHTGLVYKVSNGYFYTIEGNTSSASGVVANGGAVAYKSYSIAAAKNSGHKFARPNYSLAGNGNTSASADTVNKIVHVVASSTPVLKHGSKSKQVGYLQKNLNYLGFKGKDGKKLTVDNEFGANTAYALNSFQKKYKLNVTSVYDETTEKKMKSLIK